MDYQLVILSQDAVFSRMLELEFLLYGLRVLATERPQAWEKTDVLLIDLDSASAPDPVQYRTMIGFSRHPATSSEKARLCSMILRRPFSMQLLRREVLDLTGESAFSREAWMQKDTVRVREISLHLSERLLVCDRQSVKLTQTECVILQLLLENRGRAVTREMLGERIGGGDGNKADVYICYLRRKTDGLPEGRLIKTVRQKGYMIE